MTKPTITEKDASRSYSISFWEYKNSKSHRFDAGNHFSNDPNIWLFQEFQNNKFVKQQEYPINQIRKLFNAKMDKNDSLKTQYTVNIHFSDVLKSKIIQGKKGKRILIK